MAIIYKKIWPEYFKKIISGEKKFELRLADFEINESDTLVLEEWDKDKKNIPDERSKLSPSIFLKPKTKLFGRKKRLINTAFKLFNLSQKHKLQSRFLDQKTG